MVGYSVFGWYSGHGRTCRWLDPVANDPKRASFDLGQQEQRGTLLPSGTRIVLGASVTISNCCQQWPGS
jgi:hypothetical protein